MTDIGSGYPKKNGMNEPPGDYRPPAPAALNPVASDADQLQRAIELATQVLRGQDRNYRQMWHLTIVAWCLFAAAVALLAVEFFH